MPNYPIFGAKCDTEWMGAGDDKYLPAQGWLDQSGTEAYVQILIRETYTASDLTINITLNTLTNQADFVSRVNGAGGNMSVTITALTTGIFTDAVNNDALSTGDLYCHRIETVAGGTAISWSVTSVLFVCASNANIMACCDGSGNLEQNDGGLCYCACVGQMALWAGGDADVYYTLRHTTTLSNMRLYVRSNTLDAASPWRLRVNSGNVNQIVTVGAAGTGSFEDAANTDVIASGDEINYRLDTTPSSSGKIKPTICNIKSAAAEGLAINSPVASGLAFATTEYLGFGGRPRNATEANVQIDALVNRIARNMCVNVTVNTLDGACVFTSRIDAADGNLTVTVAATNTGLFEDLANSDTLTSSDLVDIKAAAAGTAGAATVGAGYEIGDAAGVAAGSKTGAGVVTSAGAIKLIL